MHQIYQSQSLDVCQLFFFFNYEKSMKINYISQNEKWRKKKSIIVLYFVNFFSVWWL